MGDKPISDCYAKTGAYVDGNRRLDARYCVKGFQEFMEKASDPQTVQLQRIRAALDVIAYRKRDFRAMGVSRAFSMSGPFKTRRLRESS